MKMFLNFINTLKRLKDHLNLDSLKSGVGLIKIMQKFLTIILIIALVYLIYKFILTDMFYISKFFNIIYTAYIYFIIKKFTFKIKLLYYYYLNINL